MIIGKTAGSVKRLLAEALGTSPEESNPMATATLCPPRPKVVDGTYRLSLEQYDRMIEVGILNEHHPVFLLHGFLVNKMPREQPHVLATQNVYEELRRVVPEGWFNVKEDPIDLPDGPEGCASVPEPDGAIIRGSRQDYGRRRPGPDDVSLIVEVANTTLAGDRQVLACYAFAGIPRAWIVNLRERIVEVYADPTGPEAGADARYRTSSAISEGGTVPVLVEGVEVGLIAVAAILPAREAEEIRK